MEIKNLRYIIFAALAAIAPVVAYLSWRSGMGQPTSSLIGFAVFLAAIIFMVVSSGRQAEREP